MKQLQTINKIKQTRQWFNLTSTARLLFYELVFIHAEHGYSTEFECSNQYLSKMMNIDKRTIIRNRNKLIAAGFILFQSNAAIREAGIYSFNTSPQDFNKPEVTGDKNVTQMPPNNSIVYNYNNIISNNNLEKENNKKKENILQGSIQEDILKENERLKIFEAFHNRYPGAKRTVETEYRHLQKRHADYRDILPLLLPAVEKLIKWTKGRIRQGGFAPEYPNLYRWINQRNWETILPKNTYHG